MDAFGEELEWLTADGGPDYLGKHDDAAIVLGPQSRLQTRSAAAAGRYHDLALDAAQESVHLLRPGAAETAVKEVEPQPFDMVQHLLC